MTTEFICGNTGCMDLTLGAALVIIVVFGIWPMALRAYQRWLRLSAIKKYKKEGGENEEYMIALMGEWYEEGDEDD